MDITELRDALTALIDDGRGEEPACFEVTQSMVNAFNIGDNCHNITSVSLIVHSDVWVPDTVVLTTTVIDKEE